MHGQCDAVNGLAVNNTWTLRASLLTYFMALTATVGKSQGHIHAFSSSRAPDLLSVLRIMFTRQQGGCCSWCLRGWVSWRCRWIWCGHGGGGPVPRYPSRSTSRGPWRWHARQKASRSAALLSAACMALPWLKTRVVYYVWRHPDWMAIPQLTPQHMQDKAAALKVEGREGGKGRRWRSQLRNLNQMTALLEEEHEKLGAVYPQVCISRVHFTQQVSDMCSFGQHCAAVHQMHQGRLHTADGNTLPCSHHGHICSCERQTLCTCRGQTQTTCGRSW